MSLIKDILNLPLTTEEYLELRYTILELVTKAINPIKYAILDSNRQPTDTLTVDGYLSFNKFAFNKMYENKNQYSDLLVSLFDSVDHILQYVSLFNENKTQIELKSFDYKVFNNQANISFSKFNSTDLYLFDSVAKCNHAISLEIKTLSFKPSSDYDSYSEPYFNEDKSVITLYLSADQFARAVQSRDIFIPCTIHYDHGNKNDISQLNQSDFNELHYDFESQVKEILKPFKTEVALFVEKYSNAGNLGVKALQELQQDFNTVKSTLDNCRQAVLDLSATAVDKSKDFMFERIQNQFDYELQRLPEEIRDQVKSQLITHNK